MLDVAELYYPLAMIISCASSQNATLLSLILVQTTQNANRETLAPFTGPCQPQKCGTALSVRSTDMFLYVTDLENAVRNWSGTSVNLKNASWEHKADLYASRSQEKPAQSRLKLENASYLLCPRS